VAPSSPSQTTLGPPSATQTVRTSAAASGATVEGTGNIVDVQLASIIEITNETDLYINKDILTLLDFTHIDILG